MRHALPILLVLAAASQAVAEEPIQFDIRGIKIGEPMTPELRAKIQGAPYADLTDQVVSEGVQMDAGLLFIRYQFLDNKLASVALEFPSTLYPLVVKAYTDKFGVEPKLANETFSARNVNAKVFAGPPGAPDGTAAPDAPRLASELRSGAIELGNQTATWVTTDGDFVVSRFGGNTPTNLDNGLGSAILKSKALEASMRGRIDARQLQRLKSRL